MKVFNKLVRDKIPDVIIKNGEKPVTRLLSDEEYLDELNKKIKEEVFEYIESGSVDELADIEEVLRAILDAKSVSISDFENIRMVKAQKRGAFKNKIFLEYTEE